MKALALITLTVFLTVAAPAQDEQTRPNPWTRISEKLDADGDGQITLEEFSAGSEERFNRMDSALARESRKEIYAFLAKYLKP